MGGDTTRANEDLARKMHEKLVVRLEDELEKLIKLFAFAREALENEMFSGMGYKQMALGDKEVKKLKELATGMNATVEVKIKYDKARKQLAESMTPKEERDAVVKYICSLSSEDQNTLREMLHVRGIFKWRS